METNIVKILKDCPKLTALYSPMYGRVLLEEVDLKNHRIRVSRGLISNIVFYKDGRFTDDGECMLFPSYNQRDWSKFKIPVVPPFNIKREGNEHYYYISSSGKICECLDVHSNDDEGRFAIGNFFNTYSQAKYAAKKVKELLLSLRKEE